MPRSCLSHSWYPDKTTWRTSPRAHAMYYSHYGGVCQWRQWSDWCESDCPLLALVLLTGVGREQWQQGGSCSSLWKYYRVVINQGLENRGLQTQSVFFISYSCWPGSHLFSEVEGPYFELPYNISPICIYSCHLLHFLANPLNTMLMPTSIN